MIHFAAVWLTSKYRRFYHYGTNPFPIQAVEQRHELGMVELHPSGPDPRPAERGFLEPLGKEADPAAIPPDNLDPVRPLSPEHVKRPLNGSLPASRTSDSRLSGPLRKSTGWLAR